MGSVGDCSDNPMAGSFFATRCRATPSRAGDDVCLLDDTLVRAHLPA